MTDVNIDRHAVQGVMRARGIPDLYTLWKRMDAMGLGVSYRTLREATRGERNFTRNTWVAISKALDVNPLDIIRVEGPLPSTELWATITPTGIDMRRVT